MLKGVPTFYGDRVGRPAWILREGAALTGVIAGADYEPWTGARGVGVSIKAGVENKIPPVIAVRRSDGRRPVKASVVRVWHEATSHVRSRDVEIDVHRCCIPTRRKGLARAAPEGVGEPVKILIFGVKRSGLRWHAVGTGRNSGRAGPPGRVRFETLKERCEGRRDGREDHARNHQPHFLLCLLLCPHALLRSRPAIQVSFRCTRDDSRDVVAQDSVRTINAATKWMRFATRR